VAVVWLRKGADVEERIEVVTTMTKYIPNNRNVFDLGPYCTDKKPFGKTHSKVPRKPPAHGPPYKSFSCSSGFSLGES
jgi:hypothetical protein